MAYKRTSKESLARERTLEENARRVEREWQVRSARAVTNRMRAIQGLPPRTSPIKP